MIRAKTMFEAASKRVYFKDRLSADCQLVVALIVNYVADNRFKAGIKILNLNCCAGVLFSEYSENLICKSPSAAKLDFNKHITPSFHLPVFLLMYPQIQGNPALQSGISRFIKNSKAVITIA